MAVDVQPQCLDVFFADSTITDDGDGPVQSGFVFDKYPAEQGICRVDFPAPSLLPFRRSARGRLRANMQEVPPFRSHDEKTPLLQQQRDERPKARKVEPVPMKRSDMARGANTIHTAFRTDSLMQYFDDVDTAPFLEGRAKFRYHLMFDAGIRQHRMLAVDGGAAVLKYQVPGGREDPWVHTYLTNVSRKLFDTRELTKRVAEFAEKTVAAVVDAFGEKLAEMYEIQSLGTDPEFQGQGFGSALVTAVTDMADADSHDVWLVTTGAYPFYEMLGFSIVRSFVVGNDNPTWVKEPVTVRVMHRPWKKSIEDV